MTPTIPLSAEEVAGLVKYWRRLGARRKAAFGIEDFNRCEETARTLDRLTSLCAEMAGALKSIGKLARSDGQRTFDETMRDLSWIDDECRRIIHHAAGLSKGDKK